MEPIVPPTLALTSRIWNNPYFKGLDPSKDPKPQVNFTKEMLQYTFIKLEQNIKYLVTNRLLPCYDKEITSQTNFIVGYLTEDEWNYYKDYKIRMKEPQKIKKRCFKKPYHSGYKEEYNERLVWIKNMPDMLCFPHWYVAKWRDEDDDSLCYRARITNLTILRNSYTGIIKVEFDYITERFDPDSIEWCPI